MVKEHKGRAKGVKNLKTVAVARAKLVADGVTARALVVPSRRSGARLKAQPGISPKDLMLSDMRDRRAAAHALNTEALACQIEAENLPELEPVLEVVTRTSVAARSFSVLESKMSKVPNTAPIMAPLIEPCDAGEEIDRLIAEDRKNLSSFVENLNKGVTFDGMDDYLKSWWMNRY